jgi:hypothetical protein
MTIFWSPCGPLLRYEDGTLHIEDLNPQIKTQWRMSRWEMLRTGVKFIMAALRRA